MTSGIIITLGVLLLLAYLFEITTAKVRVPSVILLLALGFGVKLLSQSFAIQIPNLNPVLPILGTVGLILIVLEGALELEIDQEKMPLILKSAAIALLSIALLGFGIATYLCQTGSASFKTVLSNVIPLAVISSAIAIPSARNLLSRDREFITYESSLSDIFGVIFFNFVTFNDSFGAATMGEFSLEMLVMLAISFGATLLLAGFLNRIRHHIKFVPIIISVVLIYAIAKEFHLPALLFILLFGLFMGNIEELRHFKFVSQFHPVNFSRDVVKFREITAELAFLIRALFFILFGFLLDTTEILNPDTILVAIGITLAIFASRWVALRLFGMSGHPLVFLAPRGLITILLFLSIPESERIAQVDKSLVTQVIVLSALVMMLGLMRYKKPEIQDDTPPISPPSPTV